MESKERAFGVEKLKNINITLQSLKKEAGTASIITVFCNIVLVLWAFGVFPTAAHETEMRYLTVLVVTNTIFLLLLHFRASSIEGAHSRLTSLYTYGLIKHIDKLLRGKSD